MACSRRSKSLLVIIGPLCLVAYALPATERVTNLWLKVLTAILVVRFAWTIAFILFSLEALPHLGSTGNPPTVGDMNALLGLATGCRGAHARAAVGPAAGRDGRSRRPEARQMNDRGLVDVPENAIRSESLAFGLSAPQLGILGAAVGFGAVANLVPLWVPAKVVLILVGLAPVVVAAILPIRGEPAWADRAPFLAHVIPSVAAAAASANGG